MQISDDWKVETDEMNVVLFHRDKKRRDDSKGHWRPVAYYGTLSGALESVLNREICGTGLKDLKVLNNKVESVNNDIKQAVGRIRKVA